MLSSADFAYPPRAAARALSSESLGSINEALRALSLSIAIRLAGCSGVAWLAWRYAGAFGLVFSAPLFGLALAKPLVDAFGAALGLTRRLAYRHVSGRHYAHHGMAIDIVDDPARVRWLKTADVRKVIQALPSDPVLERLFPAGLRSMPGPGPAAGSTMRISAEALADYLAKSTDPDSLRFKRWL